MPHSLSVYSVSLSWLIEDVDTHACKSRVLSDGTTQFMPGPQSQRGFAYLLGQTHYNNAQKRLCLCSLFNFGTVQFSIGKKFGQVNTLIMLKEDAVLLIV